MLLSKLLTDNPAIPELEISGLTADSRTVKPGYLFFAIKGMASDGHDYIEAAINAGAVAIIGEDNSVIASEARQSQEEDTIIRLPRHSAPRNDGGVKVQYITSKNIRQDLALAASRFYTKKPPQIAVVTGTNGKTSTADFTRQLWQLQSLDAASIGTLGFVHNNKITTLAADNTSPDPVTLNQLLEQVKDAAIIEGSSIGLEQHRLDGLPIKAAGFTNFTRDHLDYHGDMEAYFQAKTLLFSQVMKQGLALLNKDIPEFNDLKKVCEINQHKIITFGKNADLSLIKSTPLPNGQEIEINIFGTKSTHKIQLVGKFQIENILCALGLSGADVNNISKLKSINGRMEQVKSGIYVDYAHTPDALQNALTSLRPHVTGKLIIVFGCGGDRDKGKRPLMGAIAENLADVVIVTDDNPRTEAPAAIREQILAKAPKAAEIADRKKAIQEAVAQMSEGDVVLIAGKGHEKYQIYGREKQHFDDAEIVRSLQFAVRS